ncbi:hypothetical protein GMRT_22693 [Giardia muris]|uniref:Uncharacterized protein n=1 Tax=Giardia muris TaxID=5742 RepID=A0A4Z1SSX2_GIAMU|nr:hypothetical protein GMRT_22693 [Giardia muris]|eukprot:TNJ29026.1 hypothetical protein GMRT_22693 [Giardia muris]
MHRAELDVPLEVSFAETLRVEPEIERVTLYRSLRDLLSERNGKTEQRSVSMRLMREDEMFDTDDFDTLAALRKYRPPEERCLHSRAMTREGLLRIALDDDCATPAVQHVVLKEVSRHLQECLAKQAQESQEA